MAEVFNLIKYITLAGLLVSGTLYYSNKSDLCSGGASWLSTGYSYQYYCSSENKLLFCWKLSLSQRTCYIADFESDREQIYANGKIFICQGNDLYSKCVTNKGIQAYYGELYS